MEAFAFGGGAILLQDGANSVAAFPGGTDGIGATPESRDAAPERGVVDGVGLAPNVGAAYF